MPLKTCNKCRECKDFSFYNKNKAARDGFNGACRPCHRKINKDFRHGKDLKLGIQKPLIPDVYKKCGHCSEIKLFEHFSKNKSTKTGYNSWCRFCADSMRKEWVKKNPEVNYRMTKASSLKVNYGVRLFERNKLLAEQAGFCALCNKEFSSSRDAHLDHCHSTGKIRELLCQKCNMGLGCFNDNQTILETAIKYLKKHEKNLLTMVNEHGKRHS